MRFSRIKDLASAGGRWVGISGLLLGAAVAHGAVLTVDSPLDSVDPDDGVLTLREALIDALDGDEIRFAPGVSAIMLSGTELTIDTNLTLFGPGSDQLSIDADGQSRVFNIHSGSSVVIRGVTVTGGDAANSNQGGGGLLNSGTLELLDVVVSDNVAPSNDVGGGILSSVSLYMENCVVSDNTGENIRIQSGPATIVDSTIRGATATGLVAASGSSPIVISGSTLTANHGMLGGALNNSATSVPVTLINSTVSGNTAEVNGGGIWAGSGSGASLTLLNTTVTGNDAVSEGGGIAGQGVASVQLSASLIAGNTVGSTSASDCAWLSGSGGFSTDDYNLLGDGGGCPVGGTDQTTADVNTVIGALADNGGPTLTHALLDDTNPAIDGGDPNGCPDGNGGVLTTDQRGAPRPAGTGCDIGAYETGLPVVAVAPASHDFGEVLVGETSMTVVTVTNDGNEPLSVESLTLSPTDGPFHLDGPPALPVTLSFEETLDVQVGFTPVAGGEVGADLSIGSDDPVTSVASVILSGTGVSLELPPGEQIDAILAFFDASLADGSLEGAGRGKSAPKRAKALRHKIVAAGKRIDKGRFDKACRQLRQAYRRADGMRRPPDFVKGPATEELAAMIQDLRETLGCEP